MIKNGDFVELDYTGKIKDDKMVFDTTVEQAAKDHKIHNPKFHYKPIVICIGEHHVVKGLEDALVGKNPGIYTIEVKAEHAFGKKSAEMLKLIPMKLFKKDNVQPFVGLDVNIDGSLGIVRSVSGGRVIVDFNHPLSSKDLVYDIEVKRIVTDPLEKVKAVLEMLGVPFETLDLDDIKEKATIITRIKYPDEAVAEVSEHVKRLAGMKAVEFQVQEKKKEEKKETKPVETKPAEHSSHSQEKPAKKKETA